MIFKFFIFLILLVIFALIGVGLIFRRIKNMFGINNIKKQKVQKRQDDNVIYNKDDIVVLKGEADKYRNTSND